MSDNNNHNQPALQTQTNDIDDDLKKWIPIYQDLHLKLDSILRKIKAKKAKKANQSK